MYTHYLPVQVEAFSGTSEDYWSRLWSALAVQTDLRPLGRTLEWRAIRHRVSLGSRILEAGCGLGQWVRFLAGSGYRAVGLDFSHPTIERLRQAFPSLDWQVGDVQSAPFPDGSFDAVVSWGVIEHFEQGPAAALAELRRLLRPEGWLFVSVPFMNWRRRLQAHGRRDNRGQFDAKVPLAFHQYLLSAFELSAWLAEAGFAVEALRVIGRDAGAVRLLQPQEGTMSLGRRVAAKLLARLAPPAAIGQMILACARRPA